MNHAFFVIVRNEATKQSILFACHPHESGLLRFSRKIWIPTFAGMTKTRELSICILKKLTLWSIFCMIMLLLRDRLMAGHRPLKPSILVRIQVPQCLCDLLPGSVTATMVRFADLGSATVSESLFMIEMHSSQE